MSKMSYVAVPHQQADGSTVKELHIRLQLSLPSAEFSYSFALVETDASSHLYSCFTGNFEIRRQEVFGLGNISFFYRP